MKAILVIVIQFILLIQAASSQVISNCSAISLLSGDTVVFGRNHGVTVSNGLIPELFIKIKKSGFLFCYLIDIQYLRGG